MSRRAALVAALTLTSALLLTAQTRPPSIPLQAGDVVIRGGLIFDSVRDDAVANTGIVVRNGTLLEVNADLTGRNLTPARVIDLPGHGDHPARPVRSPCPLRDGPVRRRAHR